MPVMLISDKNRNRKLPYINIKINICACLFRICQYGIIYIYVYLLFHLIRILSSVSWRLAEFTWHISWAWWTNSSHTHRADDSVTLTVQANYISGFSCFHFASWQSTDSEAKLLLN